MNRRSASLLFVLVVAACVGTDPPPRTESPDGRDAGSSGAVDDGGADTGGPRGDAGEDGGRPIDGGDAGPTSSIACDGTAVCRGGQKCCGVGTDWIDVSCKDDCEGSYELACDDASDCGAGRVCCFVSDGGARVKASYCRSSCGPTEGQLCKTSADGECAAPATCLPFMNWSPNALARCQ